MKYFLVIAFVFLGIIGYSQVKPDIFPEDVSPGEIQARCYCKPGVRYRSRPKGMRLSYRWQGSSFYKSEDIQFSDPLSSFKSLQNFEFDFKIPIINKSGFKLLLGYRFYSEYMKFNNIGSDYNFVFQDLDNQLLKSNSFSLIVSKPIDNTKFLAFRFKYANSGDYASWISFDSRYSIYNLITLFGVKRNEDLEYGFGVTITKSFRKTSLFPFFLFHKNFSKKWGIESALPGYFFGRYNFKNNNIALLGAEYSSKSFRLDVDAPQNYSYAFNHSEFKISASLEHQFIPWVWGSLKAGYQMNFSSDFEGKNSFSFDFNADPSNALFFKAGIFISPPDTYGKKNHPIRK